MGILDAPPVAASPLATDTDGTPYLKVSARSRNLGHAFWTTPLASNAPVASTSSTLVASLAAQAAATPSTSPLVGYYGTPYNDTVEETNYSMPVYVVSPDTPLVPVWSRGDKYVSGDEYDPNSDLRTVLSAGVPVPDPRLIPGGKIGADGTDSSAIIIQGYTAWEMWQFGPADPTQDPAGYNWKCSQGGVIADIRTHPGWWSGSSYFGGGSNGQVLGADWGIAASGQSYLGSLLKYEDWLADDILHPLSFGIPGTGAASTGLPEQVLPATRHDHMNFFNNADTVTDPYRVPEGARFRLPTTFDITSWVTAHAVSTPGNTGSNAAVLTKVLRCLRDYGVIVSDSAGTVGFSAENMKTFGTPYNTLAPAHPTWGNFAQQIPWSSLVQVAVPTTDISIPGKA